LCKIGSAVGGLDMFTVTDRLQEGCHILSATTGRLKDMVEKGRVSKKILKNFICFVFSSFF
jgi:superfamily II DNA/RNA helicase